MDVLFNIIWYIFKDNEKFNPDDCLKTTFPLVMRPRRISGV